MYELAISSTPSEVVIALLKDKNLVELHKEPRNTQFAVGDIYLGKVRKVVPALNAAFVDVGYEKDAFLHYFDLGPRVLSLNKYVKQTREGKEKTSNLLYFKNEKEIEKSGTIDEVLQAGQEIVVQINKEPISTKGPRISTEISIPGRYIVLVPFSDRVSVSQRIRQSKEKSRLKKIIEGIKPKNFGVIIRTNARDIKTSELEADLKDLLNKWNTLFQKLPTAKTADRILGELNRTTAIMRDVINSTFEKIIVDDEQIYTEVKGYLEEKAPGRLKIAEQYKGQQPLFEKLNITKQVKGNFGSTVTLPSGVYLVIEHTEACHVIDVNSGNLAKAGNNQEENALAVNLEAAKEIARQLRLRDMGGIIVVDFIDMKKSANRKELFQLMKDCMKEDRAKHSLTPPSKFGLIEITRQRVRPVTDFSTTEVCPTCAGTGKVDSSINVLHEMEGQLASAVKNMNLKEITVGLHPYIHAYLTKGFFTLKRKWAKKIGAKITLLPMYDYDVLEFHLHTKDGKRIE